MDQYPELRALPLRGVLQALPALRFGRWPDVARRRDFPLALLVVREVAPVLDAAFQASILRRTVHTALLFAIRYALTHHAWTDFAVGPARRI